MIQERPVDAMPTLSSAAAAVLDASNLHPCKDSCLILAAALRAAADQVVPKRSMPLYVEEATHADWFARDDVRDDLLRIATELESQ